MHLDEATPHIHERHVFDCENRYGEIAPQQEKALEALGDVFAEESFPMENTKQLPDTAEHEIESPLAFLPQTE